jgi:phage N-6-adenine-methyltransferase
MKEIQLIKDYWFSPLDRVFSYNEVREAAKDIEFLIEAYEDQLKENKLLRKEIAIHYLEGMDINTEAMFSSKTDLWATPREFFNKLDKEFQFELDVCALVDNAKCRRFISPDLDGLKQPWHEIAKVCWMNPPYGREIGKWIEKAYEESLKGCTVVCLLPARTDTKWRHEYCMKGEIRLVKGRLKFGGSKNSAPFPSAVVIFGQGAKVNTIQAM